MELNFSAGLLAKLSQATSVYKDEEELSHIDEYLEKIKNKYDLSETSHLFSDEDINKNLVVAAAGTGKTTVLMLKLGYDSFNFESSDRIWVTTFLRSGAKDLEDRLEASRLTYSLSFATQPAVSTMHAEYLKIVKATINPGVEIITPLKAKQYLIQAFSVSGLEMDEVYVSKIGALMGKVLNTLNPKDTINELEFERLGFTYNTFMESLNHYRKLKMDKNLYEFDDLQYLLYQHLCVFQTPYIIDFVKNRYNVFYIDEIQDISQIQFEILKVQTLYAKSIFAIGDDDQSIYGFRGSDSRLILTKIPSELGLQLTSLNLNRRVPSGILQKAKAIIELNTERYYKPIQAFKEGGDFWLNIAQSELTCSINIVEKVLTNVANGESVAVLGRVNRDVYQVLLLLDSLGFYNITYKGVRLPLKDKKVTSLLAMYNTFKGVEHNVLSYYHLLDLNPYDFSLHKMKTIVQQFKNSGYTLQNIPKAVLEYLFKGNTDLVEKVIKMQKYEDKDFLRLLKHICILDDTDSVKQIILAILELYQVETFTQLETLLKGIALRIDGYLDEKNHRDKNIILSTIHSFKGFEADNVYITNVVKGNFPKQFKYETIQPNDLHEETCIFYIGLTRSKKKCELYTILNKESGYLSTLLDMQGENSLIHVNNIPFVENFKVEDLQNLYHSYTRGLKQDDNLIPLKDNVEIQF